MPINVDDAFRRLFARPPTTPRLSLDWLRAAEACYANVLCSGGSAPSGWDEQLALHCVIWPKQEHLTYGRKLICYDCETLCQFGKDSQWWQVRMLSTMVW